jgi:hypothetical protein
LGGWQCKIKAIAIMRDSELYYGLFPYRTNEPKSIVVAARYEIFRPLQLLHGVAQVLGVHIQRAEHTTPNIIAIQQELERTQESIRSLLVRFTEGEIHDSGNLVLALREQIIPYVDQAQKIAKNMRAFEHELNSFLEEGNVWIEYAEQATHEIWVIVDVLTNPNLELPSYLSNWLSMRDELNYQAKQGNMQITEALVNALNNPEPIMRIDALIDLGHLKNLQTVPFIVKCLHDEFDEVRVWAVESLKEIGGPEAEQALRAYDDSQNRSAK